MVAAGAADGRLRAVILNSGGANACTGPDGLRRHPPHARSWLADALRQAQGTRGSAQDDIGAIDVAVCSTGLIGVRLPMDKVGRRHRPIWSSWSPDGGPAAAEAIMTTDTVTKQASYVRRRAGRSAAWPRARACSHLGWPPCWW